MSRRRQSRPLRFDKRKGKWVEDPQSFFEELREKSDEFHAGIIFGIGAAGVVWCVVMALAYTLTTL